MGRSLLPRGGRDSERPLSWPVKAFVCLGIIAAGLSIAPPGSEHTSSPFGGFLTSKAEARGGGRGGGDSDRDRGRGSDDRDRGGSGRSDGRSDSGGGGSGRSDSSGGSSSSSGSGNSSGGSSNSAGGNSSDGGARNDSDRTGDASSVRSDDNRTDRAQVTRWTGNRPSVDTDGGSGRSSASDPPKTIQEFFNRYFGSNGSQADDDKRSPAATKFDASGDKRAGSGDKPSGPKSGQQAESSKAQQQNQPAQQGGKSQGPAQTNQPASAKQPSAAPKIARAVNGLPIPPLPPTGGSSYARTELLGVNLSPGALKRAEALGFTVAGASQAAGNNGKSQQKTPASPAPATPTITRLITPSGLDASLAKNLLRDSLPAETFALNQIYRPYKVESAVPRAQKVEASSPIGAAVPCRGDRCNGRRLVDWKDPGKDALRKCSEGLRVGVIDTAVERHHPNFTTDKVKQGTFVSSGRTEAPNWHGTGVLALMAGDPKSGTPGLIPDADFYSASVFFADGKEDFATDTASVVSALRWMESFGVKVINMSFAGPKDDLVEREITRLAANDVVFVAAAGNEGPAAGTSYPAGYRQVVAVTAVTKDRRNYLYANRGDHIDLAAPGVDVWTAVPDAKEGYYSGTSFAAPYVTAIMATIYSQTPVKQKEHLLARLDVQDLGVPGRDAVYGRGLVQAPKSCGPATPVAKAPTPVDETAASVVPVSAPAPKGWEASISAVGAARNPTISAGFR